MASKNYEFPETLDEVDDNLLHLCELRFNEPTKFRRLSGIVCTIARESQNVEKLEKMIMAGMDIARINFSHDSQEFHSTTLEMIKEASKRCARELGYNVQVAIAIDTKGPEIRTGGIENDSQFELYQEDMIRLTINKELFDKGTREMIYIDYDNIINVAQVNNRVFINDGAILLIVREIAVDCVICEVEIGGMLGSFKNVRLPDTKIDLPTITEQDREDITFGLENNIDMIFVSGVKNESHVTDIRNLLGERGKEIKVIAKVEYAEAIKNFDEILKVSDGILFARGDLVIQIPIERIFLIQKSVIARCNRAGKPIICATQILESMRYNARPKRSEVIDLANIILDGADCVMLSSESAIGKYPIEAVEMMGNVCREAESALWYKNLTKDLLRLNPAAIDAAHSIAISAVDAARKSKATAIIVLTTTGRSAAAISKYRPRCPIFAITRCARYAKQMHLYRGVIPIQYTNTPKEEWVANIDARVNFVLAIAKKMKVVKAGDAVVIVSAWKDGAGFTNTMRVIYAFFKTDPIDCMFRPGSMWADRYLRKFP